MWGSKPERSVFSQNGVTLTRRRNAADGGRLTSARNRMNVQAFA